VLFRCSGCEEVRENQFSNSQKKKALSCSGGGLCKACVSKNMKR
jgi:hypothetical protein